MEQVQEPPESASEATVYSLDNVALDLPIAGVGSRVLAGALDYLVILVIIAFWLIAGIVASGLLAHAAGWAGAVAFGVLLLGVFAIEYGYFAGFELATGGRTLGKMAVGLQVVTRTGGQPSRGALLLRNLVRTVDLLVGVPLMALDDSARRIGDRLAGTVVVYQLAEAAEEAAPLVGRLPQGWGGEQARLLETFVQRVSEMDADRARQIASKLLQAIERTDPSLLDGLSPSMGPVERLLRAVSEPRA